jgi:hypothetical protein
MNNRNVNVEVSFRSDEAWQHLGGISTIRETIDAVTKSTLVKFILSYEINFAFARVALYSVFNININTEASAKLTLDRFPTFVR